MLALVETAGSKINQGQCNSNNESGLSQNKIKFKKAKYRIEEVGAQINQAD